MERRRIPRERERWLSAVLIVAAIVGASAAVRLWPFAPPPPVPLLASRPLHLIESPALPAPRRLRLKTTERAQPKPPPERPEVTPVVVADVPVTVPQVAVAVDDGADVVPRAIPLLASRRLEIPLTPPDVARVDVVATVADGSHTIMELPAVAVTRVVTVAGRGIWTGLRATGAMFRAAF